jgi:hypothetical protein
MLHYKDTIKDVKLNITNREAELTKPLIRLFQDSPLVLKELLPTLSKLLNAKRKVKSNSLESKIYTAVRNLIPYHGYVIDHQSIINEVMRITNGEEIFGEKAFYSTDIGKVTHRKIIDILVDSFKAERTHKGSGNDKKRAVQFKEEDLKRKDREYNVPDKIEILPDEKVGQSINELDSFDVIFGNNSNDNDDDDDSSSEASTITTHNENDYSSSGTEGTEGTQLGDKGQEEGIADTVNNSQTSNDTTNLTNINNNDNNDKNSCQHNTEKSLEKGQCNSIHQANNLSAYTPVASLASQSSQSSQSSLYLPLDQTLAIEKETTTAATTTTITSSIVDISQNIYRLGHSDSWACKYCKLKGDKWFMGQHMCKGQPST